MSRRKARSDDRNAALDPGTREAAPAVEAAMPEPGSDADRRTSLLRDLFPEAFTDGLLDVERLLVAVNGPASNGPQRYSLTWSGKADAIRALQRSSRATLRPDVDKSIDFDQASDILVEGENLEVLKLLQRAYNDKIKLIYLDPPYNTTNDFVYNDDFTDSLRTYLEYSGQVDTEGRMVSATTEGGGRRHSGWLTFMYPRLALARNLLRQDGAIFVSIDDNEVHNLRLVMDEVFGPENFVAMLVWKSKSGGANDSGFFAVDHEYVVVYARNIEGLVLNDDSGATVTTSYNREDAGGRYALERLDKQNLRYSAAMDFEIVGPDGETFGLTHKNPAHPNATWRWSRNEIEDRRDELVFEGGHVYTKNHEKDAAKPRSLLVEERFGRTRTGKRALSALVPGADFSNPKSVPLIEWLVAIGSSQGDIVLDFFAGSGTTAEAVIRLNAAGDGDPRHFILVQLPEPLPTDSGARGRGLETIADVCRERVVQAAQTVEGASRALRYFHLGPSNFKLWDPSIVPTDAEGLGEALTLFTGSRSESATPDGIVAEVLLKEGIPLDLPWDRRTVAESDVVICGPVAVCVADESSAALVDGLLQLGMTTLIVLDDAFTGRDRDKSNLAIAASDAGIEFRTV